MHFVALGKGENLEFLFFFLSFLVLTYLTTFVTTQLSPICPWGKTLEPRLLLGSLVVQKLWVKKTHLIRLVECEIMEIMVGLHPPTTKIVAKTPLTNFVSICVAPYLGWAWFYHRNIWVMWTLLGMNMVLSPQCLNNVKPYLGWAWFYCRNIWIMWTLLGMSMVRLPQHLNNVKPYLGWAWFYCHNIWIMWTLLWTSV